ncbi:MAG TPA: PDZ domain-containing protein, partial [Rubrivivax sp.]|nr:PDZ domain-containing protein [Rubrivivax sp.]
MNQDLADHPMQRNPNRRTALIAVFALLGGAAVAQEPKGTFGLLATVDVDGILNPTLKSVVVQSVQAGLPAALAGIVPGDSVLEVDGVKVSGAKATAMAERMKKKPGE